MDMLEHRSIPRTQDLLASYEVTLADDGQVTGWHRTGRFIRGQG
jgi:adenosylmethionine-8-amino-7-oxononanoate aminotransferase